MKIRTIVALARSVLMGVLVAVMACVDPVAPEVDEPDVRPYVTAAVASTLDARGRFVFSTPTIVTPFPTITESTAITLAVAFLNTFASHSGFVAALRRQRGADVPLGDLRPDGRVEFADSPYDHATVDSAFLRRVTGPQFLVRFSANGVPYVTVVVSAYATELRVVSGRLVYPQTSGGEFAIFATRLGHAYESPVSAEQATKSVATGTRALVAQVPSLLVPDRFHAFQMSRWRIVLDRDVEVEVLSTGARVRVSSLYVGLSLRSEWANGTAWYIPASQQASAQLMWLANGSSYQVPVLPNMPIEFEEVRLAR